MSIGKPIGHVPGVTSNHGGQLIGHGMRQHAQAKAVDQASNIEIMRTA